MGASWTRSSRRSGCSAFAEQELARAVRRFGGSYELSAPPDFSRGAASRSGRCARPRQLPRARARPAARRAAFTCASVSASQASTSSEAKGLRRVLAAARRQRPPPWHYIGTVQDNPTGLDDGREGLQTGLSVLRDAATAISR